MAEKDVIPQDLNATTGESHVAAGAGKDLIGQVETRGVDYIPDVERNSSPRVLFWAFEGPQFSLGTYIFGGAMVAAGLGWWPILWATLIGVTGGSAAVAFVCLIGPRTGTNTGVSSGAFFGVRGRYLGSGMAQVVGYGFNVFTLWPAALATMVAMHRLVGWPQNVPWLCIWMAIIGIICCGISVLGHASLVVAYKWTAIISVVVLAIFCIIVAPDFKTHFVHSTYLFHTFWPTWLFALSVAIVNPISYGVNVNDYARRISGTVPQERVWLALFSSVASGNILAYLFGAFTVLCFKNEAGPFPTALAEVAPFWFLVPLVILAVVGNAIGGGMAIYNMALDLHTVLWRLSRFSNAIIVTIISFLTTYLFIVVWNFTNFLSTFTDVISAALAPWLAILIIGHFRTHGRYKVLDLHTYATRNETKYEHRGVYWYRNGFEYRALVIWAICTVFAILCSSSTDLVGPISRHFDSIDLSFIAGFTSGAVLYLLFAPKSPAIAAEQEEEEAAAQAAG
jgi:purine-cytosine permease-like protein